MKSEDAVLAREGWRWRVGGQQSWTPANRSTGRRLEVTKWKFCWDCKDFSNKNGSKVPVVLRRGDVSVKDAAVVLWLRQILRRLRAV